MVKRKIKDEKFYIEEIGVLDWLKSTDEYQTYRFTDRIEYKKNYKLHKEDGPAIEFFSGVGNQYFVDGNKLTDDEYKNYRRSLLIDNMTKK